MARAARAALARQADEKPNANRNCKRDQRAMLHLVGQAPQRIVAELCRLAADFGRFIAHGVGPAAQSFGHAVQRRSDGLADSLRPAQRSPRSGRRRARVAAPMHASAGRSHQIQRRSRENIPIKETCFHPAPTLAAGLSSSIHALEPAVDLALGLVLRHAVALLKPAAELHALTLDDVKIIVGELAPLLLNLAPELFPIAFDTIPIHHFAPVCFVPVAGMPSRRTQRASKSSDARCGLQRRAVAVKDAAPLLQKTGA